MEINPAGDDLIYSTYLGGSSNNDFATGVALGPDGTVYVTGATASTDFPVVNAYQAANGGRLDAFIARIDTRLTGPASLLYSTYLGGASDDTTGGIAVDLGGRIMSRVAQCRPTFQRCAHTSPH